MAEQYLAQTQDQRLQMILAPQLRQSLEFLQVPLLELRTLVQQEVEQNPTIEEQAIDNMQVEVEPGSSEPDDNKEMDFTEEFEVLARLDDEWKEYFQQTQRTQYYSKDAEAKRQFFLDSLSQPESLQDHLMSQLALSGLKGHRHQIGELLLGNINEDGYLATSAEEIAETAGFEIGEIEEVLRIVQEFDPIGVGARDLRECLMLQLDRLGKSDSLVSRLVQNHLPALGAKKFVDIAKSLKVPVEEVHDAARFIATLEPKPGRLFESDATSYVLPEVVVQKVDGEYTILMNDDQIPRVRISNHYRKLMADATTPADVKEYIREKVRAGSFLIKSIDQRQQTIRRIATEVVKVQESFLERGPSGLKPLTMAQIAEVIGVHETTVSRAIANKYMQTPRGTYEMKYFFTPGYKTADGESISNQTVKDAILRLVDEEDVLHPLSDQAMVKALQEQGIKVARRTIAKYRDELKILPSHLRKSY